MSLWLICALVVCVVIGVYCLCSCVVVGLAVLIMWCVVLWLRCVLLVAMLLVRRLDEDREDAVRAGGVQVVRRLGDRPVSVA